MSVKYGMIETRVRVPDIDLGGWPAVWLLGTANYAWPRCGEIDLMEMGAKQAFRDLHDTHNGGNGLDNSTVNQVVGANAIFYSDAAVNPGNPSGAASLSWDPDDVYCRPYYNYAESARRSLPDLPAVLGREQPALHRRSTTASSTTCTTTPFAIDAESDEFQQPFYLIANLAIGGAFTDAYNLGDPGQRRCRSPCRSRRRCTWTTSGSTSGTARARSTWARPTSRAGTFGIYTDATPTNGGLVAEVIVGDLRVGGHPDRRHASRPTRGTTSCPGRPRAAAGSAPASCPSSR